MQVSMYHDSETTRSFSFPFREGGGPKRFGELAVAAELREASLRVPGFA